ncbi:GIY-YIG nuclease family protein [Frigidibacter sp. MR17.24]|uniref:GIY-YIG nuclease family protein n=1 Tax=Frigidibacter sp. MR17.24 TaxID=3127345 RepID=UPI003012EDFB
MTDIELAIAQAFAAVRAKPNVMRPLPKPKAEAEKGQRRGMLYCMSEGPGLPVKIGFSAYVRYRCESLQYHTWRELVVNWQVPAVLRDERAAHKILAGLRVRGEWFADPADILKSCAPANLAGAMRFARQAAAPQHQVQAQKRRARVQQ